MVLQWDAGCTAWCYIDARCIAWCYHDAGCIAWCCIDIGCLLASPYTQTVMRISCTVVLVSNNNGYTSILIQHALEASVHASMT